MKRLLLTFGIIAQIESAGQAFPVSDYSTTLSVAWPSALRVTWICVLMRIFKSSTWEMTPMVRFWRRRFSRADKATSSVSLSRLPNPSSMKNACPTIGP